MTTEELSKAVSEKLFPGEPQTVILSYASDIGSAFDILKRLHSQGWFWRLDSVHDGVICTIQNVSRKTFSIRSATAEQAICECALKTLPEELDVTPKEGA